MLIRSSRLVAVFMVGSAMMFGGCGPEELQEQGATTEEAVSIGTAEQEIVVGWTAYTSDGLPPVICDGSSLVGGVWCRGSNCDNMRVYCQPTAAVRTSSYWSVAFSDESGRNVRYCNAGAWVTGLSCTGDYCDNLSLQCSYMSNITPKNCLWSGWHSEENGGLLDLGGYFAQGAQCRGDNCDDLRYWMCQI